MCTARCITQCEGCAGDAHGQQHVGSHAEHSAAAPSGFAAGAPESLFLTQRGSLVYAGLANDAVARPAPPHSTWIMEQKE